MPRTGVGSKNDSGYEKKKRKQKEEQFIHSQKGALLKHFRSNETNPMLKVSLSDDGTLIKSSKDNEFPNESALIINSALIPTANENVANNCKRNLDDIGLWPQSLSDQQRKFIVENGPNRQKISEFPSDSQNRHFSSNFYFRKMPNSEIIDRRWLVYSSSLDSVFCFCCKMFCVSSTKLADSGCNDWKHLGEILSSHESSLKHIDCFQKWLEMEKRLKKNQTIDRESELVINSEKRHWRNVLERLLSIIQFLGQRNLAFRGSEENLGSPQNGNFLGLIELISKFDPVLFEHLRRIKNNEIKDHYLGNKIQNEFIQLIGEKILMTICNEISKSKYYSIILDCTPDSSHKEQMTLVIRYVTCEEKEIQIHERFMGFLSINDTTGQGLTDVVLKKLDELGIPLEDCRGQGYDNGANMRGQNRGVQTRILQKNPKALFVPCGCHSWNLVLGDMAKSSKIAITFFGIIQQIYVLFSASTQRWEILKEHVKNLTVKPLSDTRWECRVESVKAIRFQIGDIYDAIVEVSETSNDPKSKADAIALAKEIKSFKFLTTLCIWYDILAQFDIISKVMQRSDIKLDAALQLIEKSITFLKEFKENGFERSTFSAKELANELEMNASDISFPNETSFRRKKIKKHFCYESNDESIIDPEKNYRTNFFHVLLDQAIMSTIERFKEMQNFNNIFGFLFNIPLLKMKKDSDLLNYCEKLTTLLDDLNALDLSTEIKVVTRSVPEILTSPISLLKYLYENGLQDALPNLAIALRILLTIPITVAAAERSFSKLKLIKTYLRATMTDARLSALALISIENDLSSTLDFSSLIDKFAAQKARKIVL